MKTFATTTALAAVTLLSTAYAQQPTENPADGLKLKTPQYKGCYSSGGSLVDMGSYTFQAMGWCQPLCVRQAKAVLAFTGGSNCLCGSSFPPDSAKVDDSHCQMSCQGFPDQKCGGDKYFAVYDDAYQPGDPTGSIHIDPPATTAPPAGAVPTDSSGATQVQQASTVFVTQSGSAVPSVVIATQTSTPDNNNPGPNKAGIAAGVVVAVIGVAAIIGGMILYMRRKKQKGLAEERRRHEDQTRLAVGSGPEKPPSTFSLADSRLEPSVMFQRRQSDGSIMDNQDYSRRILKVRNPDEDR